MKRVIVIGAAIIGFFATTLFLAPHSEAGLVEDLRSGKSDIKAVSQVGAVIGLVSAWKQAKSFPDFKAIAYSNPYQPFTQSVYGAYSAEAAIKEALEHCQKASGSVCFVYAVGDAVVSGYTQNKLADVIEAYDPKSSRNNTSAAAPNSDTLSGRSYCKRPDGSVYINWGKCVETEAITKAEYGRLEKMEAAAPENSTKSTGIKYCRREDGSVFQAWDICGQAKQITDFEYYDRVADRTASIKSWLKSIGLEQYEAEFRRNDITLDILSELTDSDLKEIGIKSLGARKRILKAAN
jgi:hypothetical protein